LREINQTKTQAVKPLQRQKCKYPGHHVLKTLISMRLSVFSCGAVKFGSYLCCCFGGRWYLSWCLADCKTVHFSIQRGYSRLRKSEYYNACYRTWRWNYLCLRDRLRASPQQTVVPVLSR